jgi:hypothetical protein
MIDDLPLFQPTPMQRRIIDAAVEIQVGLPRSRQEKRVFERACGNASLLLEAGQRSIGMDIIVLLNRSI